MYVGQTQTERLLEVGVEYRQLDFGKSNSLDLREVTQVPRGAER